MSVTVINTDPKWPFTDYVRQWALDLYPPERSGVNFWDATKMSYWERSEKRRLWGNWPRQLDGNRSVLRSEFRALLRDAGGQRTDTLVLIFLLPSPYTVDQDGVLMDRPLLKELVKHIGYQQPLNDDKDGNRLGQSFPLAEPLTNVWCIGVFRRVEKLTSEDISAARRLVDERLLNTAIFVSVPDIASEPDECEFAMLRVLNAMVRKEQIEKILRADQTTMRSTVGVLRAPAQIKPWSEAARMRAFMIRAVDHAERAMKDRWTKLQQEDEPLNKFTEQAQKIYQQQIENTIELAFSTHIRVSDAELDWSALELGQPPVHRKGLEDSVWETAQGNRARMEKSLKERIDQWEKERVQEFKNYREPEDRISEAVKSLSDGLLNISGRDFNELVGLREKFERKRDNLLKQATEQRKCITESLDQEGGDEYVEDDLERPLALKSTPTNRRPAVRLRLGHGRAFKSAVQLLAECAFELIRSPADRVLVVCLMFFILTPIIAIALGDVYSGGGITRLVALPPVHLWYVSGTTAVVLLAWITISRRRARSYRRQFGELRENAKALHQKADEILTAAIQYHHLTYGISWLNYLIARLKRIEKELELGQMFEKEFALIEQGRERYPWLQGDVERDQLEYCNTVVPKLAGREGWLRVLMEDLPPAEQQPPLKINISGVQGELEVENKYLHHPFPVNIERL